MSNDSSQNGVRDTVFDVDIEKLSKVYAQAVLDAAGEGEDSVVEELESIGSEVLDKFPDFQKVLSSALVSQDEKLALIDRVFGNLSQTTISFLKVLTAHERLELLPQVVRSVAKLWKERSGKVPVEIELALETSDSLVEEMVQVLRKKFDMEPVVNTVINPELIAGFVVRIGDQVLDASARTSFEHARTAMVAHAVEAIQSHPDQFIEK